jgi:hypothetical protein
VQCGGIDYRSIQLVDTSPNIGGGGMIKNETSEQI